MGALDYLKKVTGITIFNKLAPKLLEMASVLDFDEPTLESLRKENNPVEGVKFMFKAWLSGEISLPPTWRVLVETFQAIDRGELAQEIKHFFNRISVTSPSASLVSHVVYWVHTGAKRLSFSFLIDIRQRKGRARARLVYNPIPGELCAYILGSSVHCFKFLFSDRHWTAKKKSLS